MHQMDIDKLSAQARNPADLAIQSSSHCTQVRFPTGGGGSHSDVIDWRANGMTLIFSSSSLVRLARLGAYHLFALRLIPLT